MLLLSAVHHQWEQWQLRAATSTPLHDDPGPTHPLKDTVEEQKIISVFCFIPMLRWCMGLHGARGQKLKAAPSPA